MKRCTENSSLLVVLLTLAFVSSSISLSAQDTVPQGSIKVRRAPVASDYYVKLDYVYHPKHREPVFHFFGRSTDGASFSPPEPAVFDQRDNDSSQTLIDSSFMITFYNREENPGEEFPWIEWLNQYEHTFGWNDTTGIDSATFVYEVNARGQVKFRAEPLLSGDSSAVALQQNLSPILKKLWIWYPAVKVADSNRRRKKTACTVRVKVYAVKEGYDPPVNL
jgi:hypothetical protein